MDLIVRGDTITGFKNAHEKAIAYKVRGKKVKRIGKNAFKNCSYKYDFNIPKGVQIVEDGAFDNALFSVIRVPFSVKSLGNSKFSNKLKLIDRYTKVDIFIGENWSLDRLTCENKLPVLIQLFYVVFVTAILLDLFVTKSFIKGVYQFIEILLYLFLSAGILSVLKQLYLRWRWK